MRRCVELARLGAGYVAPNPMVGSVLVHEGRIIGEGYHGFYGGPHAEVNCLASVMEQDKSFIAKSKLYVSLEPCNHFGKTPPCTDLILKNKIPEVIIGCIDRNALVSGKGVQKLREAGIKVMTGILEPECTELNKRFFSFQTLRRPYLILKWAQTSDGIVGLPDQRLHISNACTNLLVHQWRGTEQAILVGKRTLEEDDPQLSNRNGSGNQPVRVVLCRQPPHGHFAMYSQPGKTIVFNTEVEKDNGSVVWKKVHQENYLGEVLSVLFQMGIQSVLVEGGPFTLQRFFDSGLWDECRIITNTKMIGGKGAKAPVLPMAKLVHSQSIMDDSVQYFVTPHNNFVACNELSDYF